MVAVPRCRRPQGMRPEQKLAFDSGVLSKVLWRSRPCLDSHILMTWGQSASQYGEAAATKGYCRHIGTLRGPYSGTTAKGDLPRLPAQCNRQPTQPGVGPTQAFWADVRVVLGGSGSCNYLQPGLESS